MTARKVKTKPPSRDAEPAHNGDAERYQRLPTGAHGLTREQVADDQRERLRSAMIELIAERGYPAVRILDLTQLAHVSRPTFYNLYADKEELLLGAYQDIAGRTTRKVAEAYGAGGSPAESVHLALLSFAELATVEPAAMTLALLGTFGAGPRALASRNLTLQALEQTIQTGRGLEWSERPVDLTTKFLIGGIREVSATRLRQGRSEQMPDVAGELSSWAAAFPPVLPLGLAGSRRVQRAADGSEREHRAGRVRRAEGRLPSGRHDLPRDEVVKSQRERIVDATATIVAEKGLAGLTIPEIASRANVSHETFYEMYPTKHDAFLGAQKIGLHQALRVTAEAFEPHQSDWPAGIAAGLDALTEYLCSEPAHAHLTLVDTFGASPEAIEIRASALQSFNAYLRPGYELAAGEVPEITAEAIVGGIWQVLHHYIERDRLDELCDAASQLAYLTLTPFLGAEAAADVARQVDGA
jgi:AcrR family transcriptional regulator